MAIATMTSKGQVTVPANVRAKLRLVPGSKLHFEEQPNGDFIVRRKTIDIRELRGMLPKPPRALAIDEMKDAAARGIAEARLDWDR